MKQQDKKIWAILILILLIALILRVWNLDRSDMISDQAINSFRAVGYVDFLSSNKQSTPMQWFDEHQWWQNLSFHDHPPLVFFVQHVFFRIFDASIFIARLPFAIFGILSVLMLYFLSRKLFNKQIGLLAIGLLAISNFHLWISRLGYLESFVIFFSIATLFFVYRSLKDKKQLYWAAVFLALGILSKYSIVFLLPVIILFWLIYDRKTFKSKHFYFSIIVLLAILSPIIIYNFNVYLTRGHFDATLSSMLGQKSADFAILGSRSIKTDYLKNAISQFQVLGRVFNPIIFYGIIISFFHLLYRFWKAKNTKRLALILFSLVFLFLEFTIITDVWFLTLYLPFFMIILAYWLYKSYLFLAKKFPKQKSIPFGLFIIFIAYTFFYSVNSNNLYRTIGPEKWAYAASREKNTGYNLLDDYLDQELVYYHSEVSLDFYGSWPLVKEYQEKIIDDSLSYLQQGEQRADFIYIFDPRIDWFVSMWIMERRKLYQQFNFVTLNQFDFLLVNGGIDSFYEKGFNKFYFIYLTDKAKRDRSVKTDHPDRFKNFLEGNGLEPIKTIYNVDREVVFKIYKLPLEMFQL